VAFTFAAFCYMLALGGTAALIFFAIWHIIAFEGGKTDYKNPIDQCNTRGGVSSMANIFLKKEIGGECLFLVLNTTHFPWGGSKLLTPISLFQLVGGEYLIHAFFCVMFLWGGEWLTLGLNMPLLAWGGWRYMSRPVMSGPGGYDPTTIMNADILAWGGKEGWCKLAFYLLSGGDYLYG
ncbi:CNIH1 protein, partial [Glaucidium brasilianum]|nr:CNIH1 protein [Glaucidium brasilianum]